MDVASVSAFLRFLQTTSGWGFVTILSPSSPKYVRLQGQEEKREVFLLRSFCFCGHAAFCLCSCLALPLLLRGLVQFVSGQTSNAQVVVDLCRRGSCMLKATKTASAAISLADRFQERKAPSLLPVSCEMAVPCGVMIPYVSVMFHCMCTLLCCVVVVTCVAFRFSKQYIARFNNKAGNKNLVCILLTLSDDSKHEILLCRRCNRFQR